MITDRQPARETFGASPQADPAPPCVVHSQPAGSPTVRIKRTAHSPSSRNTARGRARPGGLSVVEVLIVVFALAITAALVVPHFAGASDDAKRRALESHLKTIRAQLELYKVHHGRYPPGLNQALKDQLCAYTDAQHAASPTRNEQTGVVFGPYLFAFPSNPFNGASDVTRTPAALDKGWFYDPATGEFRTNDTLHDSL
ncbi:MAG: hypothetical protein IT449_15800 [Phycisphaerales bacterium]|nr:hypothetical protein [Phycisphaerales bacterium]